MGVSRPSFNSGPSSLSLTPWTTVQTSVVGKLVLDRAGQRGPLLRHEIGAAQGDVAGRVEPVKLQIQLQPRFPPGEFGGQGRVAGQLPAVGVDHDVLDRQLPAFVDDLQQLRMQRAVRRR